MFQYAAAKALSIQNGTDLKLDISEYANDQLRNFDLLNLNVDVSIASKNEIDQLKASNSFGRVRARLTSNKKKKFYKQPFFHFDNNFFNLGANIYIQGYFQSEKYFLPIKEIIKKEFTIKQEISDKVRELGAHLQTINSVAVHIRKGDYKNIDTEKIHGILPIEYYQAAFHNMGIVVQDPRFYIFTDDKKWVEKKLQLPNTTIVSGNISTNHFEDLFLMTHCCHNIIANSSFSWWGAWLNKNENKVVIAPANWFNNGPRDTQDLIPKTWTTI